MKKFDLPEQPALSLHKDFCQLRRRADSAFVLCRKLAVSPDPHAIELAEDCREAMCWMLTSIRELLTAGGWTLSTGGDGMQCIRRTSGESIGGLECGGSVGEGALPEENSQIDGKPCKSRTSSSQIPALSAKKPAALSAKKPEPRKTQKSIREDGEIR